jgi:predicted NBD/HSP70 family sugar kinase
VTEELVLAADIGGTHMRAALVDAGGAVVHRRSAPTPTWSEAPAALIELIRSVRASDVAEAVSHAVVGLPGDVDYRAGRLLWAPNLPESWPDLLSQDQLSAQLGLRTHIANDADLAVLGEAIGGAGRGTADQAYLTISTGIGAGVVLGGELVHGVRSLAEVGHTIIDWHAWRRGEPATLEELGSGSGIARLARETGLGELDAVGVEASAREGDERAAGIWRGAIYACAAGVANVVMSYSPSLVVIGGGLGLSDAFFAPMRRLVLSHPWHFPDDFDVVASALRDDAGLCGAAHWEARSGVTR